MSNNVKQRYAAFAATAPDLPLFCQPWYLDALTKEFGDWDVLLYRKGNGPVRGAFPFFVKSKYGLTYSVPPPLCKYVGPWLLPEYRDEQAGLRFFAEQFPKMAASEIAFPVETTDFLPFYWNGWRQTTRFTFYLTSDVWSTFPDWVEKRTRNRLRAAAAKLTVVEGVELTEIYRLTCQVFARQKLSVPYSFAHLQHLDRVLTEQGRCHGFGVKDADGRLVGALYLIWDAHTAYVLLSGTDATGRQLNGNYLLQTEAARYAFEVLQVERLDRLGSMLPGVAGIHRKLGAVARPYHLLCRERHPLFRLRRAWESFRL